MKLGKAIFTVGGFSILARFTGIAREILMANYIGAGMIMDVLVVAVKIPSFLRRIFSEGALNASFVPMFSELFSKDRTQAKEFAERVLSAIVFVLLPIVLTIMVFMPSIAPVLFPKFTGEKLELTIYFMRFVFPYILMITLTALVASILNSLERFVAAASYSVIGNCVLIISLSIFPPEVIAKGETFMYAILISSIVQLVWVLWPCYKAQMPLKLTFPKFDPKVKSFFSRMLPAAVSSGVIQISLFVGIYIAGTLPTGSISFLHYSDKMLEFPLSVIGVAISISLLPHMVKQFRTGNTAAAVAQHNRAIEMGMLLAIPSTIILIMMALPLINAFFNRGAFATNQTAAYNTSVTLWAYASGLPAYIMVKIFSTVFFARQDVTTPIKVSLVIIVTDVILCLTLIRYIEHVGIAVATSIVSWLNAIILGTLLNRQGYFKPDHHLKRYLTRVFLATLGMALVMYGIKTVLFEGTIPTKLQLAAIISCCIGVYIGLNYLMKGMISQLGHSDNGLNLTPQDNESMQPEELKQHKKVVGG